MAEMISFNENMPEPELDSMSPQELRALLKETRQLIQELDRREPRHVDSEEYEAWGERHEELEDLADEIMDRLDEMGGANG